MYDPANSPAECNTVIVLNDTFGKSDIELYCPNELSNRNVLLYFLILGTDIFQATNIIEHPIGITNFCAL